MPSYDVASMIGLALTRGGGAVDTPSAAAAAGAKEGTPGDAQGVGG